VYYKLFLHLILLPLIVTNLGAADFLSNVQEQTGFVPFSDRLKNVIWIHGKEAGEIVSIQKFIEMIKEEIPGSACYVTAATEEGERIARRQKDVDHAALLPHENILSMAVAFERINPKAIVVLEHEIHPTMLFLAQLKSIPIYLLNAQFTTYTVRYLTDYAFLYRPLFNIFNKVFAQSDGDTELFKIHGILPEKLISFGNIKTYNVLPKKEASFNNIENFLKDYKEHSSHAILLVASVHQGECDIYLNLFTALKKDFPFIKMILAPRRFDWKDELCQKVVGTGYSYFLWDNNNPISGSDSKEILSQITEKTLKEKEILLVCSFGKLFDLSAITDICFPGGTFVSVGGHNLLESAVWANPIVIGPRYENCKQIADQLEKLDAIIKVETQDQLIDQTIALLASNKKRVEMGNNAFAWLEKEAKKVKANLEKFLQDLKKYIGDKKIVYSAGMSLGI